MQLIKLAEVAQEAIYKDADILVNRQYLLTGLHAVIDFIKKESLTQPITIANFGTFKTKTKADKRVNTKFTKGEVVVPAHKVVQFIPAPQYRSYARYSEEAVAATKADVEAGKAS